MASGRTSGLNAAAAFGERTAFKLAAPDPARVRAALDALGLAGPLHLDPAAIDCWVAALRMAFPDLSRFDKPDTDFDAAEIDYKRERAERLSAGLAAARTGGEAAEAVRQAFQGYNLFNWRVLDPLAGGWDKTALGEALLAVARGGPGLAAALGRAVTAWMAGAPDPQRDHARQVAGAVAMHLHPREAVVFRHNPLNALHREATGLPFPRVDDPAEDFSREVAFARQVFDAFAARGLAPRDLMDVQGALWVIAKYDQSGDPDVLAEPLPKEPFVPEPLNTILYGPPGTGKTYATMFEAVAICDGRAQAEGLEPVALRDRYEALRVAGRIAFVTFHQSFSYEDFVEGLRPETDAPEEDGPAKAGFRLVARKGVLREIADLAAKGRSADRTEGRPDLEQRRIFKMSLGRAHNEDQAYLFEECTADKDGYVLMGWGGKVDWSAARFDTFEAILKGWQEVEPGAKGQDMNVRAIGSLRNDMREGDVVIVSNGNSAFRAVGVVSGPYEFDDRGGEDHYHHKRRVRWTWVDPAGLPVSTIIDGQFSQQSIYRITQSKLKLDALAAYVAEQQATPEHPPHVLVIDEINRANVSKVFGELITLLEEDKRAGAENAVTVRLPYSGEAFLLPANLHVLGTMNTADRSIALLDTALRRRFAFVEMPPRPNLLGHVEGLDLVVLLARLNERIEYLFDRDHLIGHAFFMGTRTRADVDAVMRRKVIPLLAEYFHEDWERIVAIFGGHGKQGFIERTELPVPPGLDAEGETRWRYQVREAFPEDAYAGLQP